jgi:hypothetical protein
MANPADRRRTPREPTARAHRWPFDEELNELMSDAMKPPPWHPEGDSDDGLGGDREPRVPRPVPPELKASLDEKSFDD